TFNCGVGMVVCVAEEDVQRTLQTLDSAGETAWRLGAVETADPGDLKVEITGPLA
ncbi:MAG: phosphoribosylformylglycinamidine cyclo-ligase, partial [Candidatus Thiodiazotropha sp. (ex Epidulcina cf. delphinae)]|nr:phosphoribosylformylglycinamidine cyclo-ligase [Candidatus Thiodiazotropha sp. (ex Epidulcina cf. delphinae)]